jgi:hypothetical protein
MDASRFLIRRFPLHLYVSSIGGNRLKFPADVAHGNILTRNILVFLGENICTGGEVRRDEER